MRQIALLSEKRRAARSHLTGQTHLPSAYYNNTGPQSTRRAPSSHPGPSNIVKANFICVKREGRQGYEVELC